MRITTMPNVLSLIDDLRSKNWCMTGFYFNYNKFEYIVIFEDSAILSNSNPIYPVHLTFTDLNDNDRVLETNISSDSFEIANCSLTEFRNYFHIDFIAKINDFMHQFYIHFGTFIPKYASDNLPNNITNIEKQIINNRENNTKAIYCYDYKRNGLRNDKQQYRTPINEQKTLLRYPHLYKLFKNDKTISFCYTDDISKEISLIEMKKLFASRNGK